jgi:hypothetical protein
MFRLCSEITISAADGRVWQFNSLKHCTIVEDTATLTDTCVIELPKKTAWQGVPVGAGTNPPIKRGDKIVVKLGYDDELKQRFVGYIRNVNNKTQVKIECEDGMFALKLAAIKKQGFKSITLGALIEHLLSGTGVKYKLIDKDVKLGYYRITKTTVAEELNELKKEFGLMSYFRNYNGEPFLYVGFTYPFDSVNTQKFIYGKRIIDDQFEYKRKEDIKVKVKAKSVGKNNKKNEVEVGDKEGELIEVNIFGLDKTELKKFADKTLANAKYDGLRGSFTTFGEPVMNKTDKCYLETMDGNKGTYLSKKITINFGKGGYRQDIEIGQIVNKNE